LTRKPAELKFAAIDIGSNAIRLLIEEVHLDGEEYHIEKVSLTRVPVRLGEDVFTKGKIGKDKIDQLVNTMFAFYFLMDVHGIEIMRACATSAMREAKNSKSVIKKIKDTTGLHIEILSGDEEADLIFSNYFAQNLNHEGTYLYIDVGGGSTELTLLRNGKRLKGKSFELGTVRMLSDATDNKVWDKARRWIQSALETDEEITAIGTGGNINTLFKIAGKKPTQLISRAEIEQLYERILALTMDERITKMRMKPDRADVIIPACEIYRRLMDYANIQKMIVPKIGLSDGIILDLFNKWRKEQGE
jgi:exopolyphosphatase/guanosine-5'-triphosphate,3'-diphosphate pyrophosphatase